MKAFLSLVFALGVQSTAAFIHIASCRSSTQHFTYQSEGRSVSKTCLFAATEPLAEEGTWQAFLDEDTTGLIYYFDTKTGESLWEPPTETFPAIRLPRKKQRIADDLRRKYRKARQTAESFATPTTVEAKKVEQKVEEKVVVVEDQKWMGSLFDVADVQDAGTKVDTVKQSAVAEEPPVVEKERKKEVTKPDKKPSGGDWLSGFLNKAQVVADEVTYRASAAIAEEVSTKPATKNPVFLEKLFAVAEKTMEERAIVVVEEEEEDYIVPQIQPIKLDVGSHVSAHPAKIRWGGEDAVFSKGRTFGVFDGVSGAEKIDGIPLYSKTLAKEMNRMVGLQSLTISEMTLYLTEAAEMADSAATGASTACVGSIGENGFLQVLNLGDSAAYVIRNGRVAAKTRDLSHYWECPYQLSEDSPDRPKDGTKLNVELMAGDMVVMGSDGIFDNLTDNQILDVIQNSPKKSSLIAKKIVELSRKESLNPQALTPFAKQAQRRGDKEFKDGVGGKVDDASCVVVLCK
jgi:protein phosphatase PTC7